MAQVLRLTIPFILGVGIYYSVIPIFLSIIFLKIQITDLKTAIENFQRNAFSLQLFRLFGISALFFIVYWIFYIPYNPESYRLAQYYFLMLPALYLIGLIWILTLKREVDFIQFLWIFCFGSFIFSAATIGLTIILKPPPYYSSLINILSFKIFTNRSYINSPGVANLLTFFPIAFMAGFLLNANQRPKHFWILGLISFAISLALALTINQRSYFIITLIICPLIVCVLLAVQGVWKLALCTFLLLACYPLLWLANSFFTESTWNRPLNVNIMNDGRFQMLSYWFRGVTKDPFAQFAVGPTPWDNLQWFHNFFADVHRLSGFWALAAALLLFGYIFWRLVVLIRVDKHIGCFLMAIAIPVFLIMNTSVVPEGERQPFLLLLFIGLITELVLAKRKSNTVTSLLT